MQLPWITALTLALSPTLANATTFVVDDDGGPGVDFTDIPDAVAVAQRRDLILVRPGQYSGFELRVGLTLLGEAGVSVGSGTRVTQVPGGDTVVLALCDFAGLELAACQGTVLLSEVQVHSSGTSPTLSVEDCDDLRLHRSSVDARASDGGDAVHVRGARVELVQSTLVAGDGAASPCGVPTPGGQAIVIEGRVHAARSILRAGRGGDSQATCGSLCGQDGAGYGGTACVAFLGEVIVAGDPATSVLRGGDGGLGEVCDCDGSAGPALFISAGSTGRTSGTGIESGDAPCLGSPPAVGGQGLHDELATPDPTLELEGTPSPGMPLRFRVHGTPGTPARLRFARRPTLAADGSTIEGLVLPVRTFQLGTIPNSGSITRVLSLPASFPVGFTLWAQAELDGPAGLERTNSVSGTLR